MKTSELQGAALDYAVAKCEVGDAIDYVWKHAKKHHSPSTDWAQGGPIIEREKIEIAPWGIDGEWRARDFYEPSPGVPSSEEFGPTPLIAAMRCYCCAKLGEEIDIPQELQPCQQPNL